MIGHVSIGSSFYHCISYCLEDKRELSEEKKLALAMQDHLQHKERAEVLEYNKCFGNKYELTGQFKDVRKLSRRIEKPMLHLTLRLAPEDTLTKEQLREVGRECAKEFGIADNQYICVLHKDTKEQHIHIAANRVGFDGKVANDSNSYKRMAELCRRLEKKYGLQEVLSPRAFLSPKDRLLPRHDSRKEKLKADIQQTLKSVSSYLSFERQMRDLGYKVLKGRGISFIDDKKVKIKGSEVGFSLTKIEKILRHKEQLVIKNTREEKKHNKDRQSISNSFNTGKQNEEKQSYNSGRTGEEVVKEILGFTGQLTNSEYEPDYIDPELMRRLQKKKKKSSLRR
ncbi:MULTISPECIES: relaxase/mobilization nuclease domain-containing protein [unclassified Flavobacterium]|uniref:relaxase/mobilization nuclease domain-containing protein n=1 Tax=unclassified Flavobacterium TaxID=196869 RepID=UPI000B6C2699|nr:MULTISPECIES: relaxase/mobilization nuclease domain-containing protein [unclassified Flavobacterium]MCD0471473.1 relaxase/mobilization nuclease domain-containing protein [Flavobacterium sp. JAS]SNR32560.1 Relaxase/Mobilisation nuclease domain-containing protein [Flavobacterium sp. ov086]